MLPLEALGKSPFLSLLASDGLLVILGVPRLVYASLQSLPPSLYGLLSSVSVCSRGIPSVYGSKFHSSYEDTGHLIRTHPAPV